METAENPSSPENQRPGDKFISIGRKIEQSSEMPVDKSAIVLGTLATAGAVGAAVYMTQHGKAEELERLADHLSQIAAQNNEKADTYQEVAKMASLLGSHDLAVETSRAAVELYDFAIDNYDKSIEASHNMVSTLNRGLIGASFTAISAASIAGVKIKEWISKEKAIQGTIPVSTHIGPALGRLFVKIGEKINERK